MTRRRCLAQALGDTNVAVARPFSAHTDCRAVTSNDYWLWAGSDVPPAIGVHRGHLDATLFGRNRFEEAKIDPSAERAALASEHDRAHLGTVRSRDQVGVHVLDHRIRHRVAACWVVDGDDSASAGHLIANGSNHCHLRPLETV